MSNVEQLAQEVYGPDVSVQAQELAPQLLQVGVVHAKGIALLLVTARTEESGLKAMVAALQALKAG